jgi:hypothetical protein
MPRNVLAARGFPIARGWTKLQLIQIPTGGRTMTTPAAQFDPVHFCQFIFSHAHTAAKKRLGMEPATEHVQMSDLITAFRDARQHDYGEHFGLVVGEWNESMAIIKTYLAAADPKKPKALHPDLGLSIGNIIERWGRFEELPKDIKTKVAKAKKEFLGKEDILLERSSHFFNETKIRASSLETPDKEGVCGLIILYQPQVRDACHKGDIDQACNLLSQFRMDLERLIKQSMEPSRPLGALMTKTKHDISNLETFGNKGRKKRK